MRLFPMPLTDVACRTAACSPDKARLRLTDAGGLYLEVSPPGSKRWFWKYYFNGKEKRLALGRYADAQSPRVGMSLRDAREARDKAREEHRAGVDPVQRRRLDKLTRGVRQRRRSQPLRANCTRSSAAGGASSTGSAGSSGWRRTSFLDWRRASQEITAPLLLQTLRRIESRGAHETAHTLRQTAGQVFRYGVATGRCDANPAPHLHGALRPIIVKHMAAVLEPAAAGSLLRAIWAYEGQPLTSCGIKLSALTFQRPGNIREMEWHEIDFDTARWIIPAAKMKRTVQARKVAALTWFRSRLKHLKSCGRWSR